jgi:hypothetical protein
MKITIAQLKSVIHEAIDDDTLSKDDVYSIYSDVYKEKHGIRPRWVSPDEHTVEELQSMLDRLYAEPPMEDYDFDSNDLYDSTPSSEKEEYDWDEAMLGPEGPRPAAEIPASDPEEMPGWDDDDMALPTKMGMGREVSGHEKRSGQGDWAGSAGRKHMKTYAGR